MTYQFVIADKIENVGIIRLNRPDRLNALSVALLGEILSAVNALTSNNVKSIVITGEGRAFCSGGDLADEDTVASDPGETLDAAFNPLLKRLADLEIPVVTAINGPAVGAGFSLALVGDISVMARSAYVQAAFVRIGLVPDFGLSWLLARTVGRTRALEIALLGERIEAERALSMGLVTRVTGDAACFETAFALARQLAAGPTVAIGLIRRQIAAVLDADFDTGLALERAHQARAAATADFREAIAAFREKRIPDFKGQ